MKQGIIIATCIAIVTSALALMSFKSGEDSKKYVLLEIYEVPMYEKKGIYIHKGDGAQVEYIPFQAFRAENHDDNGEKIVNTVNKLVKEGYHIEHVTSGVAETGMITKIFMHK